MSRFENWKPPEFSEDGWTKYGWRCQYPTGLVLGNNVDIGCFTYMNANYGIKIGEETQIGSHCSIYSNDTYNDFCGAVIIGKNVLIGSHSLVLPMTEIPDNARILAYSIVMKRYGVTMIKTPGDLTWSVLK